MVETAEAVKKEIGSDIEYHVGTMIEIPRACLLADDAEAISSPSVQTI